MGIINYNIEPHFDIKNKEVLEELKEISREFDIYALEDDAFIIEDNGKRDLYGNIYKISKGKIKKIN